MRVERKTDAGNGVIRLVFVVLACILQIAFLYFFVAVMSYMYVAMEIWVDIVSLIIILVLYGRHKTSSMKMPWLVLIAVLPILGTILWFLMESEAATRPMRKRFEAIDERLSITLVQDESVPKELLELQPQSMGVCSYLCRAAGFPIFRSEETTYFADTRDALNAQLADLEKAQHFIFMEYYAIEDRESFARIHEVLKRKVKEGVEVRLFYDDVGSIGFINTSFADKMRADGIRTRIFNKVVPSLRIFMNNRDHRKITVIDGLIAYTGGYNLANEYFNVTHPYGEWSDSGIRVTGPAVNTFTTLFLEMWNAIRETDRNDDNFGRYYPRLDVDERMLDEMARRFEKDPSFVPALEHLKEKAKEKPQKGKVTKQEYIQPYADSPLREQQVGEDVYLTIINSAVNYVWFVTPYLILTDEMSRALTLAAERGVDVRIVTPGIPDKKKTYQLTRSYYAQLVREGVRIYEFTPGFCHNKICVSDDRISTCGTFNLDYRSLYHHFEDGCVMYGENLAGKVKDNVLGLIKRSREVTQKYREGERGLAIRIFQCILRLFAPLM